MLPSYFRVVTPHTHNAIVITVILIAMTSQAGATAITHATNACPVKGGPCVPVTEGQLIIPNAYRGKLAWRPTYDVFFCTLDPADDAPVYFVPAKYVVDGED